MKEYKIVSPTKKINDKVISTDTVYIYYKDND